MAALGLRRALAPVLTVTGLAALFALLVVGHRMTVATGQDIPLVFHHRAHGGYNCVTCHHDFLSPVVTPATHRTCIACHRETPQLAPIIRDQFHDLCEGCHLNLQQQGRQAGPVHECRDCHARRPDIPAHGRLF
ncbi:cytochrome c3 family protein [Komagataeibacter swingsii]|uniref:cytochrome c3 family protein n=1 Tax=Komagataeibacter swingsii TaxID=215220 RepID=UPI001FC8F46F|nr:cytochrome c3 family protein [Komagataeibacter swingsii]GBQ64265.1 hypothetical protein AA16373_2859 [Komagataeibacter swingsii DSM 16373]